MSNLSNACVVNKFDKSCGVLVLVLSSITLQYSSRSSSITASSNSCGSIMTLLLAIYQWYSSSPSSLCRLFVILVVLLVSVVVSGHLTSIICSHSTNVVLMAYIINMIYVTVVVVIVFVATSTAWDHHGCPNWGRVVETSYQVRSAPCSFHRIWPKAQGA